MIYPKKLRPGGRIGIVAPSSMIDDDRLESVRRVVSELGLYCEIGPTLAKATSQYSRVKSGKSISLSSDDQDRDYVISGYAAGSPANRANDINHFFADLNIDAIFCLRGGYSSAQIMPYLDYELIKSNPKIILGYSDVTNILNGITRNTGLVTYHAPMVTPNFTRSDLLDNGQPDKYTMDYFKQFILGDWSHIEIKNPEDKPIQILSYGQAEGQIVGGNLQELAWACGTDYGISPVGKILFIEEVKSHIVMCDMALTQLRNNGVFDKISGLIIGDFLQCRNMTGEGLFQDYSISHLLDRHFKDAPFPVIAGLKLGHDKQTITIPIGANCQIDSASSRIIISR